METPESTCWTVVRGAASGDSRCRRDFVHRYAPVARAYLAARWRATALVQEVDDALQEVFLDCFREGGALTRAEPRGAFVAFLRGVVRNVALRVEERRRTQSIEEQPHSSFEVHADDPALSVAFDRAWARTLMAQAAREQGSRAEHLGEAARRRVELLRLRFRDGLAIRDIAERWGVDPAHLHHEYARARREFQAALREVVAAHHPGSDREIEQECLRLVEFFG